MSKAIRPSTARQYLYPGMQHLSPVSLLTPYFINFQRNEDSNPVGLISVTAHSFLAEDKERTKSSLQPVSRIQHLFHSTRILRKTRF